MIVHDVEQGSEAWLQLRLGMPTSSEFHRIVTPKGKLSTQARRYAIWLVTEQLLNRSLQAIDHLEWVERGKLMESEAVRLYEFENDVRTWPVGFITTDDGRIGCSPDRLIGGAGPAGGANAGLAGLAGLEIKCPAPHTHMEYLLDGFGDDYMPQVQGQMLVAGFEYVDRMSYHPEMPPVRVRTWRDEAYLRVLADALAAFCDMKDELLERARVAGQFAERAVLLPALNGAYGEDVAEG